jgi:uncharacterized protein
MDFKNKKNIFGFLGFLFLLLILFIFFREEYSIYGNRIEKISLNGESFKVEIVKNQEKTSRGLSGRNKICERCGMLFDFSKEGKYGFWMKGMKFDIDIIWIRGNEIVYISRNVPSNFVETIKPDSLADKVLEVNSGTADKLDLDIGEEISFLR